MVAKLVIDLVVLVLKPKNIQCDPVKIVSVGDGKYAMGIKLFH
jgi:hypothetical protein